MKYKFIDTFSEFILNETLKTNDIDFTINSINRHIAKLGLNHIARKNNNTFKIIIRDLFDVYKIEILLKALNSIAIDQNGWFPSLMMVKLFNNMDNIVSYNEDYILKNKDNIKELSIIYEAKYDEEVDIPHKLYHLTIKQFEDKINRIGLVPKSKNKLSKHLDRIYLCSIIEDCKKLIPMMKSSYMIDYEFNNIEIDTRHIIYEIDTTDLDIKLFKDPNYNLGYYCVNNIPPHSLKIIK